MDFIIRKETENDYRKVEETVRAAFDYPERTERGRFIESDIYDDELNREAVRDFDRAFG